MIYARNKWDYAPIVGPIRRVGQAVQLYGANKNLHNAGLIAKSIIYPLIRYACIATVIQGIVAPPTGHAAAGVVFGTLITGGIEGLNSQITGEHKDLENIVRHPM